MINTPTTAQHIPALQLLVAGTGMFPPEMVPELLAGFLADEGGQYWLSCFVDHELAGFYYAVEETLADGSWNMIAIGVSKAMQGKGIGLSLVQDLETHLIQRGARILVADTSGLPDFAPARAFYAKAGYQSVGRIPDFWAAGDDKVVFWKSLRD
jgi:ribosomal protein S18 acetylase RimI-like enzyme